MTELHPDDILFFAEVASAMKRVAQKHGLYLRTVGHLPGDYVGFDTDRWGDCDAMGNIRLLLRAKVDGRWTSDPLSPEQVWRTAAHELAHLKYMDHSSNHEDLTRELEMALNNQQEDHRQKILRKLVKMQAQRDSEQKIGNSAAAEAFAGAINRMLLEYELRPSDIDYARTQQDDPVIEVMVDLERYHIKELRIQSEWQNMLARVVAKAHLCTNLVNQRSNHIWFVGTRSHATVAEYAYGTLVHAAAKMSEQEYDRYYKKLKYEEGKEVPGGFKISWLRAFIYRISERFEEERAKAVKEISPDLPGSESTALLRLDGAMTKVKKYIDEKFTGAKCARPPRRDYAKTNADGRNWGRAAADRLDLGRKGLEPGKEKKRLGE